MRVGTPRDIGLMIRERRNVLDLDQAELARKVGVSRQWLIGLERGKQRADVGLIIRTLNALGLILDIRTDRANASTRKRAVRHRLVFRPKARARRGS